MPYRTTIYWHVFHKRKIVQFGCNPLNVTLVDPTLAVPCLSVICLLMDRSIYIDGTSWLFRDSGNMHLGSGTATLVSLLNKNQTMTWSLVDQRIGHPRRIFRTQNVCFAYFKRSLPQCLIHDARDFGMGWLAVVSFRIPKKINNIWILTTHFQP